MHSRRLPADLHIFGLVMLFWGACTYELPTATTTGGLAGAGNSGGAGGGGGAAGEGGVSQCPGTQMLCNGGCTDTLTDPFHCGNCLTDCGTGFFCEAGMCKMSPLCIPSEKKACYSGPAGTENLGQCRSGTQTCAADGSGWGACEGEVKPGIEVCGNPVDENCDGIVAPASACLVGSNLVVRYFLDEASEGQGVTVVDSAPNPLNLPVAYDMTNTQPSYIAEGAGRGLEWKVADQWGVARAPTTGTKVKNMLDAQKKVTIEVVARIDGATANHTRLFAISTGQNNVTSFGVYSTPIYVANFNDIEVGHWSADFGNLGRAVFHVVIDTTDTNLSNRVRFYINGMPRLASGGTPPSQDAQLAFLDTESICLGNRDTQGRSFDGVLYYAALYADALTDVDIATNAEILKARDDR